MGFVVFYITHPNEEQAQNIASLLIEKRYVACANIYPVGSEYHWNGKVEKDAEWVSLCKTSYDNIERVESLVKSIHVYETPCITHLKAAANVEYEKWILKNVLR